MADKKALKKMYSELLPDSFPNKMEISFYDDEKRQTLFYEKKEWVIGDENRGLRYGENPGQEAALYRLVNGNLCLGDVECIKPGKYLASDVELLQSGKHPGKINITDVDSALNILRYFSETPVTVIIKHNNPCGVAQGHNLADSYYKALMADRIAAFGGAVAVNRSVDKETAELITGSYNEVVAAPDFEDGVMDIFSRKKNLRVMQIKNIEKLREYVGKQTVELSSLIDGGMIVQWSYVPKAQSRELLSPAKTQYKGKEYEIKRLPADNEYEDMIFGWLVESGITSNSVIFVKDGVTVGIGTGEQDRVGVAEIARDKAYKKYADRLCWETHRIPLFELKDPHKRKDIEDTTAEAHAGISGSIMVSDGFFPFRDGIDVGIAEGIRGVVQPGGSLRDFECIEACNEHDITMVFTGERSFRH
jgi:phosphoribosylaminoimidazolecarboxamide formyltransferase/IMP cyclohydrolase